MFAIEKNSVGSNVVAVDDRGGEKKDYRSGNNSEI